MKTVKEYANSVGKSHQSVYKQLNSKKNKERLENHVWKQDGTTYLDDVAIDILNESRQMIQIQNDIQTHEENDNLRKEVNDLKNKIINLQDELKVKTEQMTSLLLENKEKTLLLEQKKDQGKRPGTETTGRTTEPQKDLAEERLASLRSHKPSRGMEEPSREIGDTDTETLIREARAGIDSSRTREENSGADRANREAERSRQRAEAQRRAEEAKREAEARQAQRRARSRSYGIER